jgi:site-specific recombinase XerD
MEPKFKIGFIGKRSRTTRQHLLPIYLRVTIDGKRFEVATHQHVKPSQWLPSAGKAIGRSESINQVNTELDLIKKKVYDYKDRLQIEEREFTVNSLRQKWFGQDRNTRTLLEAFRLNILDFQQLVVKGVYKKSTLTKYITAEKHLINYLKWRNTGSDILLIDLRHEFAVNFEYYLQGELGMTVNASGKMIKNLKKVVRDCVEKDWLDKDPFWRYKVKHIDPKVPHLSADELKRIEEKEISILRLDLVRDVFLFSCYTGFAYVDVANLTADHIRIGVDGKKWLMKNRRKTDIPEHVPILPPAERILSKYRYAKKLNSEKLLPVPSNQRVNAYLKEIAVICEISTKITFHVARHTFATTITLDNGVPIDSVSKMLGHRSVKTTQIYARVTDRKVSGDINQLFNRFVINPFKGW